MKIYITRSALEIIESFKQFKKTDPESGGILIGQIKEAEVYIMKATTPNKFDKASRYSFECNKDAAQVIIDFEFINSGKKSIYIGEWHTHPENTPTPSTTDKTMIKTQFTHNKLNEPFIFLLIQGLEELYIGLYNGKKIEKVNMILLPT